MTALTTKQASPIPDKPVTLGFTLTESGSNYVRVWLTDAPADSEIKNRLEKNGAGRFIFYEGGENVAAVTQEFDKPGTYVFAAQEYDRGASTHGGGYEDDPESYDTESTAGTEATLTLSVGSRMSLDLYVGADSSQLVCYVFGSSIRSTTEEDGEVSPRIDATTVRTAKARAAAESATVLASVAALKDLAVSTAIGDPTGDTVTLISKYNLHIAVLAQHAAADTDNDISAAFGVEGSVSSFANVLQELARKLNLHMRNARVNTASPTDLDTGSQGYHVVAANNRADFENLASDAVTASAGDMASCMRHYAELYNAFKAHDLSTTVHNAVGTQVLPTPSPLLQLLIDYGAVIRNTNPTAPATANPGAVRLANHFGFKDA